MHHLIAYEEAIDNTANADTDAVPDRFAQRQNDHFIFGRDMQLAWFWGGSATHRRSRISQPSFRSITRPYMIPAEGAVLPPDDPAVVDMRREPLILRGREEVSVEATSAIACGTEQYSGILAVRPSFVPAPSGFAYTLRGTSVSAATARTWTQLTVTWDDNLRSGVYAVVGGVLFATNGIAFRCVFENQEMCPGGLSHATEVIRPWYGQLKGGMGEWGRFVAERPPMIEVYNNGTDNSHTVYLDVVRVG